MLQQLRDDHVMGMWWLCCNSWEMGMWWACDSHVINPMQELKSTTGLPCCVLHALRLQLQCKIVHVYVRLYVRTYIVCTQKLHSVLSSSNVWSPLSHGHLRCSVQQSRYVVMTNNFLVEALNVCIFYWFLLCDLSSQHCLNVSCSSGTQELAESAGECGSVRKGKEDERAKEVWQEGEWNMRCHVRAQQNLSTALRTHFSNETSVDSELVSLCRNVRLCMCVRTYVCAHLHMHACVCTCIHI